jgi:hypothetical protein
LNRSEFSLPKMFERSYKNRWETTYEHQLVSMTKGSSQSQRYCRATPRAPWRTLCSPTGSAANWLRPKSQQSKTPRHRASNGSLAFAASPLPRSTRSSGTSSCLTGQKLGKFPALRTNQEWAFWHKWKISCTLFFCRFWGDWFFCFPSVKAICLFVSILCTNKGGFGGILDHLLAELVTSRWCSRKTVLFLAVWLVAAQDLGVNVVATLLFPWDTVIMAGRTVVCYYIRSEI